MSSLFKLIIHALITEYNVNAVLVFLNFLFSSGLALAAHTPLCSHTSNK